jgi:hypothetical protein
MAIWVLYDSKTEYRTEEADTKQMLVRETDCFEKRDNDWQLIHQHASVRAVGEWDGKIITA